MNLSLSLGLADALTLFITLVLLALTPGIGQAVVAARTFAYGLRAGIITSIGIGSGDVVYIALVCFGLASLHEWFAQVLVPVKWLGAAYLLWMAVGLLKTGGDKELAKDNAQPSHKGGSHFLWGFAVTLGNPKVILFYLGLLPALVDIPRLGPGDVLAISVTAVVAVSGVMAVFAWLAFAIKSGMGRRGYQPGDSRWLRYLTAALLAAFAVYLIRDLLA